MELTFKIKASLEDEFREDYVSDDAMNSILSDKELTEGLKKGIEEISKGKYKIVEEN